MVKKANKMSNENEDESLNHQENEEKEDNEENEDGNEGENNNNLNETSQNLVDVTDVGINTDELPKEELDKLVANNVELKDANNVSNIGIESRDVSLNRSKLINSNSKSKLPKGRQTEAEFEESKRALINELNEKDKIFDLLVKSNNELKEKIELSTKKYEEILNKIEEKKNDDVERKLTLQIREMEKEINANNNETERYKKMIDQLKNKMEFKQNLERAFNLQSILKQETLKNKELTNELNTLKRINEVQNKYISNYDKENQITEKLNILQNEIKQTKDAIKDYQDKYIKQDKFIRLVHEKILSLEMLLKKSKEPKIEIKKCFTKEELKETLELISNLKSQIKENRLNLSNLSKQNDMKIHKLLAKNKQIELEYKENEKLNRTLMLKRSELKKNIRNAGIDISALREKLGKLGTENAMEKSGSSGLENNAVKNETGGDAGALEVGGNEGVAGDVEGVGVDDIDVDEGIKVEENENDAEGDGGE